MKGGHRHFNTPQHASPHRPAACSLTHTLSPRRRIIRTQSLPLNCILDDAARRRFQLDVSFAHADSDTVACLARLAAARTASASAAASGRLLLVDLAREAAVLGGRLRGLADAASAPLGERVGRLETLQDSVEHAKLALIRARQELELLEHQMEMRTVRARATRDEDATAELETVKGRVRQCRRGLQALQSEQRTLLTRMLHLRASGHFPEILVLFPQCLPRELLALDLHPAVLALLAVGRALESYSERVIISTTPSSRHDVWKASFEDQVRVPKP